MKVELSREEMDLIRGALTFKKFDYMDHNDNGNWNDEIYMCNNLINRLKD